jgi:predicted lipoprotein with Yx(FWY)xxD motif
VLLAGAGIAALTGGLALAGTAPLLKPRAIPALSETIVVNSRGRTVYELQPETVHHLLCARSDCTIVWPIVAAPATGKLSAGPGVKGRLGRLRRGKRFQLTLDGRPLYTFLGDTGRGQTHGDNIESFNGKWHVVTATVGATTTTTTVTTTTSTYTFPGY